MATSIEQLGQDLALAKYAKSTCKMYIEVAEHLANRFRRRKTLSVESSTIGASPGRTSPNAPRRNSTGCSRKRGRSLCVGESLATVMRKETPRGAEPLRWYAPCFQLFLP